MENVSEEELRAFFGKNSDYYIRKWEEDSEGKGLGGPFNVAAFLLPGFWLAYRKMYRLAALFLLSTFVLSNLVEPYPGIQLLINIIGGIFCGGTGNYWYFKHVRKSIETIRAIHLSEGTYLATLNEEGGTSFWASIVALILVFVSAIFVHLVKTGHQMHNAPI